MDTKKFNDGDKIWYKTVNSGWIKAKVLSTRKEYIGCNIFEVAIIRVTSRKNKIFPCGYVFSSSVTHMVKR